MKRLILSILLLCSPFAFAQHFGPGDYNMPETRRMQDVLRGTVLQVDFTTVRAPASGTERVVGAAVGGVACQQALRQGNTALAWGGALACGALGNAAAEYFGADEHQSLRIVVQLEGQRGYPGRTVSIVQAATETFAPGDAVMIHGGRVARDYTKASAVAPQGLNPNETSTAPNRINQPYVGPLPMQPQMPVQPAGAVQWRRVDMNQFSR